MLTKRPPVQPVSKEVFIIVLILSVDSFTTNVLKRRSIALEDVAVMKNN